MDKPNSDITLQPPEGLAPYGYFVWHCAHCPFTTQYNLEAWQHAEQHDSGVYEQAAKVRARDEQWVPLDDVRKAWQAWKQAWGTGDSEEAYALMEMDQLLGVDADGNVL